MATKKTIDGNTIVSVASNVGGDLIYDSDRYSDEWHGKGDVLELPFDELMDIRRRNRKFYENNWLLVTDGGEYSPAEIYEALGVSRYYPDKPNDADIDTIITMKPAQLTKAIEGLTPSRKEEIVGYVRNLIDQNDERVDSKTRLNALGKALGVDFNDET